MMNKVKFTSKFRKGKIVSSKRMSDGKWQVGVAFYSEFPDDLVFGYGKNEAEAFQDALNSVEVLFKK